MEDSGTRMGGLHEQAPAPVHHQVVETSVEIEPDVTSLTVDSDVTPPADETQTDLASAVPASGDLDVNSSVAETATATDDVWTASVAGGTCELEQYASDSDHSEGAAEPLEKGSDRDPDGSAGQLLVVECRNPVLCEESLSAAACVVGEAEADVEEVGHADDVGEAGASSPDSYLEEEVSSVTCSQLELVPNSDSDSDADDELSGSGGGAISRFLRSSMRKMWHFRTSSQRGGLRRRSSASQASQSSSETSLPLRTAAETRAARSGVRHDATSPTPRSDSIVCCSPAGDDAPPPGLDAVGGAQTQAVYMSTLLDRLNATGAGAGAAERSGVGAGSDVIQVSTRQPHLHDAPLPALDETSVAFDTPPPPLATTTTTTATTASEPRAGPPMGSRGARLLSRGSSFLGVYQTLPELSTEEESRREARGYWQHNYSSPLACLTCTIGLGAVCRFALFGGIYGVAFIIQFGILSLLVGMPLMTLHMTLGQYIGSGIVDMWRISPIFKGIGLAAVLAELVLGIYTIVPVAWMLVYLRDSFVSSYDHYKWAACPGNCTVGFAELVTYTVPQYFNQRVLQRDMSDNTGPPAVGYLGFEISFNLAVAWILVYLSLGRGLRSYGKVVYVFAILSVISFVTVCIQLLSWAEGLNEFFTDKVLFDNVFWSTGPWVVAARETFLVWGLHGAALMAITSHNKFNHSLRRDTTLVAFVTLVVLFLSALFGFACLHALKDGDIGYGIGSSSFETEQRSRFLIAPGIGSSHSGGTPPEVKHYTNLVSGVIIKLRGSEAEGTQWRSGYQVHRLATELFPSLLAAVGGSGISSFWALVFYLSLLLFGVGQQLAIWRSVIEAVISLCPTKLRAWELTTTFVLCLVGFGLSLPLMTEIGIHVVYFLDYCVGCLWWLVVIYVLEVFAVFYIRGSPFASTQAVTILISRSRCMTNWAGPFLSFVWHVLLPMALLVLAVVSFRTGGFEAIFTWEETAGYGFWGLWVRQLGSMLMMFPILLVPVVGLVQAIRYVKNGDGDLYDRIQSLYRPEYSETMLGRLPTEEVEDVRAMQHMRAHYTDPPPKYTPPPSYSTATGARLAKMLRQSVRRSVRHVRQLASSSGDGSATAAAAAEAGTARSPPHHQVPAEPPPSYASILLETLPAPLRRSMRRLGSSFRRPAAPLSRTWTEETVLGQLEETEPAETGHAETGHVSSSGHQRSFSLGLLRPSGAACAAATSRSLPRDMTPEQVREVLRSGRLSLPETRAPEDLCREAPETAPQVAAPETVFQVAALEAVLQVAPQEVCPSGLDLPATEKKRKVTAEEVRQLLRPVARAESVADRTAGEGEVAVVQMHGEDPTDAV